LAAAEAVVPVEVEGAEVVVVVVEAEVVVEAVAGAEEEALE